MALFLAIPVLGGLVVLQSAVVGQIHLLGGSADLVLLALVAWAVQERVTTTWHWAVIGGLMAGIASALPFGTVLFGYLLATGLAIVLRRWVWQAPLLAMLAATFLGTIITQLIAVIALRTTGTAIPLLQSFNLVTLPSGIINLLLAIPMYAVIGDLADWLYPEVIEI